MVGRTSKELAKEYPEPEWRKRFVRFVDLMDVLSDCIISNEYSIPDDLNSAIVLSAAGVAVKDRLIRKLGVPPKEAQLMCALTLGHAELFVDVEATDLDKLTASVHRQIVQGEILFPYSYGRDLYDAYANLFEEEKDVLTLDETFRLLKEVPGGVFQYGQHVTGPFGLQLSLAARSIQFNRRVPAYHCAQPVCHAVHPVRLTTGHDAAINSHQDKLARLLEDDREDPSEWERLAQEFTKFVASYYGDQKSGTVVALIGDCLSDVELRKLVARLLDGTKGKLRTAIEEFLHVGDASECVESLTRPELLQIVLIAEEESITSALDALVRSGEIVVPKGEVRRPVTNISSRSGAFRLGAELGFYGVRFTSSDPGLASLRERRLLSKLYIRESDTDTEELDWQLRGFEAEDLDERLEDFFRSSDPRSVLRRMILARKTNMITACADVGIEDGANLSDEALVETVLWKLGFDVHFEEDPHGYFWDLQQRISALTQSSRISGIGDSETFRGVATSYFTELEGLLCDALAFATWALTSDHTAARFPFSYDNEGDRAWGLARLQLAHDQSGNEVEAFDYTSDKLELYSLIRGFGILADSLESLDTSGAENQRAKLEFPDYVGETDLKLFIFVSVVPFLDLTHASRTRLVAGLRQISKSMLATEVNQVRNDYSHYRRTAPEVEKMAKALEAIGAAVRQIENLGISRLLCWPTGVSFDAWGRSRHEFTGPRSIEHMFARPSNFDWMGLPAISSPQYLVRAASFAEPNEILRFTRRFESDFSAMWHDYPSRRKSGSDDGSPLDETPAHPDDVEISGGSDR